jgi:ATP-dependent Clp protease adaptor protein ClpS
MGDDGRWTGTEGEVLERPREKAEEPELWCVFLLNDDYTTMEFVVEVLETVFLKSPAEAHGIMMHVHLHGRGRAGVYPYEVAETKVAAVGELAQSAGFPLQADMEPE